MAGINRQAHSRLPGLVHFRAGTLALGVLKRRPVRLERPTGTAHL